VFMDSNAKGEKRVEALSLEFCELWSLIERESDCSFYLAGSSGVLSPHNASTQ